jgi:cob(I)alamin adenosyltransferase
MKIYTKTGDDGTTGLFGGPRVRKDSPRLEAFGTVDELNAVLGFARAVPLPLDIDPLVARVQNELFDVGAELASPSPGAMGTDTIGPSHIALLEAEIDHYDAGLPPLTAFILPGGTTGAATLHLARTVCRRAERRVLRLGDEPQEKISPHIVVYLNRLSDWLFVLARAANSQANVADVLWVKSGAGRRPS